MAGLPVIIRLIDPRCMSSCRASKSSSAKTTELKITGKNAARLKRLEKS